MRNKLTTKLSTKVIMSVAEVFCMVWKYGRCNLRRKVNDFDYHIHDLRCQFPNEVAYHMQIGELPFFSKVVENEDEYEKTVSVKIGDANIRYTFDKLIRAGSVREFDFVNDDQRLGYIRNQIQETQIRQNQPDALKVIYTNKERESNVVKLSDR